MKKLLISSLVLGAMSSQASVMNRGQQMMSLDTSFTTASKLFGGGGAFVGGGTGYGGARTTFLNYGIGYGVGIGSEYQIDARVAYTTSSISGGSFGGEPNNSTDRSVARDGDSVSEVSEVSLKVTKTISEDGSMDFYVKYATPGSNTNTDEKLFIAVNDFTNHLALGLLKTYSLSNLWSFSYDLNYTHRFQSDDVPDSDQMGGQVNLQGNWGYRYSDQTTLSTGFALRETLSGPDIGGADFYAVKERVLGASFAGSYYMPNSGSWLGYSLFQKLYGANTDSSTTLSLNWGKYF